MTVTMMDSTTTTNDIRSKQIIDLQIHLVFNLTCLLAPTTGCFASNTLMFTGSFTLTFALKRDISHFPTIRCPTRFVICRFEDIFLTSFHTTLHCTINKIVPTSSVQRVFTISNNNNR